MTRCRRIPHHGISFARQMQHLIPCRRTTTETIVISYFLPLSSFLIISLAHYFLFGASFLISSTRGFELTLLGRTIPTLELLLRQRWMFPNPVPHHITYHRERRLHDSLHDDQLVHHHEPASPRKFGHGDMSGGVWTRMLERLQLRNMFVLERFKG